MSSVPTAATPAARVWLLARVTVRWAVGFVVAAWSILLLAWLALHWLILPHIDEWRVPIEQRASVALGANVRIGRIEVRSGGWVPALELRDVTLADASGRESLRLPRVAAALSARSLLALEPRFEQLFVDAPELDIRRDPSGRIFVAGIDFSAPTTGDDMAAADWFFAQHEFVIRGGRLRWIDERRSLPTLELSDVSLVVRNGLRSHDLRIDATPPAEWGDRFTFSAKMTQPLLGRDGDWRRWSGTLHAALPRANARDLRRRVDLPFELHEGDGSLRAWIEIDAGHARAATVDFALRQVSLQLGPALDPLAFERLEGRVVAERDAAGVTLAAEQFGFTMADRMGWPSSRLTLAWLQREGGPVTGGRFDADRLDLALMAGIASRLPIGDAVRRLLAELAPRGVVGKLSARWDGPLDSPRHYQAAARLSGLSIAARAASEASAVGRPGLANADIEFEATERGGSATLALRNGAIELPGVLDEPVVALDALNAQLAWRIEAQRDALPPRIELQVRNARFANADAQGTLDATWSTGAGSGVARGGRLPGVLDLSGKLERGLAASTARYMPRGMPATARQYVQRALKAGVVSAATFKVKGDLSDFPFHTVKHGEFRIAARVHDVAFDYVPSVRSDGSEADYTSPWPGLTNVAGELVVDRTSMEVRNAQARLGGFEWSKVNGSVRDFFNQPTLVIEGNAHGPLVDALHFVNATPIAAWTGHALERTSAAGAGDLKLALQMPLKELTRSTVSGSVTLAGNDVRIQPDTPLLGNTRARVDFTHKGFAIVGGAARVLGGDATFEGGTQPDGVLRFSGQGVASAEALRRASELGMAARVAAAVSGQAAYRLSLAFVRGVTEVGVTSNLVGMVSDLPAPLRKSAEQPLAFRYQTSAAADSSPAMPRDTLRFELGNVVQAQFVRDLTTDVPHVLRGGVGVFEAAPQASSGVHAHVNFPTINVDAWEAATARWFDADASASGDSGYTPTQIALRAQELVVQGRRLTRTTAGLSQLDGVWRANIEADQLNGYAEWRPARSGSAPGRVYARLVRLSLPRSEAESVESMLDTNTMSIPALDIMIDDFELRGKRLGRIEIDAINRVRDGTREWMLSKLSMTTPEAQFNATGLWSYSTIAKRRSLLDFRLDLTDSGAFLERLGTGKAIRGGKGRLAGQVGWAGSPLAFDLATLSGDINVALDAGQFLKAEPGAARLLGVLSLQSLPRRLVLDFRDLFQEGFPFDAVTGDVKIASGVASTNNLRMRGVQAAVLMEGSADLVRETQDLRVVVVPEINAGTASLAYAVINPAVGLGTFLAQVFLRRPMMEAGTREFRVSGSWAEPQVVRLARSPNEPLADDAAAAAPAPPATPKTQ